MQQFLVTRVLEVLNALQGQFGPALAGLACYALPAARLLHSAQLGTFASRSQVGQKYVGLVRTVREEACFQHPARLVSRSAAQSTLAFSLRLRMPVKFAPLERPAAKTGHFAKIAMGATYA